MLRDIFFGKEKIFTPKLILFHAALILISFAFVYVFSYSTSFRYNFLGGDSAVFQVMGKYWLEGVVPYKDLFDHKGPIVYVVNALGYAIYPRAGVMVPQIICLYLSCLFVWRAMELYSSSAWKIFFMLLTLIYYAAHYEEGNHVSEYSVPFLSAAAYCFLRALKDSEDKKFFHPPLYGFIYGFGFGACFLIRLSDAAQICCQTFLAAIFLLQVRDFRNLRQNVLSFCAGFATIVLPFVIYFAAHGALYDALYGILLFNLEYMMCPQAVQFIFSIKVIFSVYHFMPLFVMILISIFAIKENPKSRLLQSGLFIGIMLTAMLIILRHSIQYAMILLSFAPIFFAVFTESNSVIQEIWQPKNFSVKRMLIKISIFLMIIHVYVLTFYLKTVLLNEQNIWFFIFSAYDKREESLNWNERRNVLILQEIIPDDEKDSFVCWGEYCTTSHWILHTGMKPRERLFMNNSWLTRADSQLRREWFGNVRKEPPLWILYGTSPPLTKKTKNFFKSPTEDAELEQLLAEKYSLKGETFIFPQVMKLYRLKE